MTDPLAHLEADITAALQGGEQALRDTHKPSMWMYLDDSGDGSCNAVASSHLIMSTCVFRDTAHIQQARSAIDACAERFGIKGEFKFSKVRKRVKDDFFERMADVEFSIRAIVVDKALIRSPYYRAGPSQMKGLAISQLLSHGFGEIRNAKVFIDGEDTKAFGISDAAHFRDKAEKAAPGSIHSVKFADSKQNRIIQIADMHAGAINATVRREKPRMPQYFETFKERLYQPRGTYWHFQ